MNPWLNILPTYTRSRKLGTRPNEPHRCSKCGETDPEKFYTYADRCDKQTCKSCKNKRVVELRKIRDAAKKRNAPKQNSEGIR